MTLRYVTVNRQKLCDLNPRQKKTVRYFHYNSKSGDETLPLFVCMAQKRKFSFPHLVKLFPELRNFLSQFLRPPTLEDPQFLRMPTFWEPAFTTALVTLPLFQEKTISTPTHHRQCPSNPQPRSTSLQSTSATCILAWCQAACPATLLATCSTWWASLSASPGYYLRLISVRVTYSTTLLTTFSGFCGITSCYGYLRSATLSTASDGTTGQGDALSAAN